MNKIKCLAVDDEMLSLDLLEDNIKRVPFLQLVKRCNNAFEAMQVMQREQVDLVFLDIQMPGLSGTQFLQGMTSKPIVIFVTAYKQYALEGFELDVLDYLVKPVAFERFLKAVNKAAEYHAFKQAPQAQSEVDYFFVSVEYNLVKVMISDITHVEALKDYVKIYLSGAEKPLITRLSLKTLAEKLPFTRFTRVHRSYIVALDKITSIRKERIYLNQYIVPVSDFYKGHFFSRIENLNLK